MNDSYILHIVSWYPHEENPFEGDFVHRHIQCISTDNNSILYFSKAVNKPKSNLQKDDDANIVLYSRLFERSNAISNYSKYHAFAKPDILKIFKTHGRPSVIHCHAGYPGLSISQYFAKKYKIPLILTEHSTIYQQEKLNFKEKLILKYLQKYLPTVDVVCPVSTAHLSAIQKQCRIKTSKIIPNVVSDAFFETLLKKSKTPSKLLHISSLDDPQKNITDIIKAFALLRLSKPNVTLTIIGNSNIKATKRLFKKLKIETQNVKILGPIEHEKIPQIMTEHDLFVLWSRYESFSLVIAESWASGLPVISNDSGGISGEINDKLGCLVDDYTPDHLSAAIASTLDRYSDFDLIAMRQHAQNQYSEKSISKMYSDLYTSLT